MSSVTAELVCHTQTPTPAVRRIQASVRIEAGILQLRYAISGAIGLLNVPGVQTPERRDELWRYTCCELFIGSALRTEYDEFNFSPSSEWAAYRFQAYRQGMTPLALGVMPTIRTRCDEAILTLDVQFELADVADRHDMMLALSAVVEESNGHRSYWALKHPEGKPDFHDRVGFVLPLRYA